MIKIKKIIFSTIKSLLILVVLLTVVLFFYASFFFDPPADEKKIVKNEVIKNEEPAAVLEEKRLKIEEKQKLKEALEKDKKVQKKIKIKTTIEDGIFATVGNKAVTKSDIVNEIKVILILNKKSYSENDGKRLHEMAIKSIIKRNIKRIEIEKNDFLQFSQEDLKNELLRLANNINVDLDTLKKICANNELDFTIIEDQIKTQLLWNSLIFQLYKNRISINLNEIDEQLKLIQNKKEIEEYLISEIVIKTVENNKFESTMKELKNKIKNEGFENVALNLSISDSASRNGDLGWINENLISKKLKSAITNTPVGSISKPILLANGILIFKVRNKRKVERNINMEEMKNELVNLEKTQILNMHSSSHYNNLKRSIVVKFFQ